MIYCASDFKRHPNAVNKNKRFIPKDPLVNYELEIEVLVYYLIYL